jgi:CBS domain-containing protein
MMLRVQQLMTQNAVVCHPDHSLSWAAQQMWEKDIGVVVVVDSERRAIAMLTDRDVCMSALTTGRTLSEIPVSQAMSKTLFGVRPDQPVEQAAQVMREQRVRRVPVLDNNGHLLGVLSQNDLVKEAARERESPRKELSATLVNATLAAIGSTRAGPVVVAAAE